MPAQLPTDIRAALRKALKQQGKAVRKKSDDRLLSMRRNVGTGWNILRIPWDAVPDYDFEAVIQGLTDEMVRQEVLLDWTASVHKRVFPNFSEIHIARDARDVKFDWKRPLVCGWDFGMYPAFVPTQLLPTGQWCIYPPLTAAPNDPIKHVYDFGQMVHDHLHREYAVKNRIPMSKLHLVHIGDPAGQAKPPRTKAVSDDKIELRSAFQVLDKGTRVCLGYDDNGQAKYEDLPGFGWRIQPGAVAIRDRLEAVDARLRLLLNGRPSFIVHPDATEIIEAFQGGYHYKQRQDGTYELDPEKNWYSHPMDALQYVATRLFAAKPLADEDEDTPARTGFRSQASNRRNR